MGMTHLQLQNAVVDITGRSDKKTSGVITTALNLAQHNAASEADFERLRTAYSSAVVEGDSSFTPSATILKLYTCRALRGGSSDMAVVLDVFTDDKVLKAFPEPSTVSNGVPEIAYLEGGSVKFLPPANDSYTFEGKVQKAPDDMSADGDYPDLNDADLYLIYWASGFIYNVIENPTMGDRYLKKAEKELEKLTTTENKRAGSTRKLQEFQPPLTGGVPGHPATYGYHFGERAYENPFARRSY